jgi:M6 family metalloprotease-like protein
MLIEHVKKVKDNSMVKLPTRFIITLIIIIQFKSYSAPLRDVPQILIQPNGDTLYCFASGDEYYNWLHDKEGYTIIQDKTTGYYTYATIENNRLLSTKYVAGKINPINYGFKAGINISPEMMKQHRKEMLSKLPTHYAAPSNGIINNIVVFIRFKNESEFTDQVTKYISMLNAVTDGANSMYRYFREVSYGTLTVSSTLYPTPTGSTIVSYQDSFPRAYYQPYNAVTNPIGYQSDRTEREHTLLVNAIDAISLDLPTDLNVDSDHDGNVDNVCFIVSGGPDAWNDLLWPHMTTLYSQYAYLNGVRVFAYNLQLQSHVGVGVLCHEMSHSIGFPDLYHYTNQGAMASADGWDIMENDADPPQHMGAYMKWRYTRWINSIPTITNGLYTLSPITSSTNNCYKIVSANSSKEFFIVEYRKKEGTFESSLPSSGLLVYRINSNLDGQGNAGGPPDEVYIYRPNGTPIVNGSPGSAAYSLNANRTMINDLTNPSSFLTNGSPGGLLLWDVGNTDTTISFRVGTVGNDPYLLTDKTIIDFRGYELGGSISNDVLVTNVGGSDLRISSIMSDNNEFTVNVSSDTLKPKGSRKISITFHPIQEGTKSGNIIFTYNNSSSPDTVHVLGSGIKAFAFVQTSLNFGPILVGTIQNKILRIKNLGTLSNIFVSSVISENNQFVVPPDTFTVKTTGPSSLMITFTPTSSGEKTGNIIFTHSAFGSPDTFHVSGIAQNPSDVSAVSADIPKDFALSQNYPNPFNPSTTFNYDLPARSKVLLKIFNTLGQIVLIMVDEIQTAGHKSVKWNANKLSSGVYFYRMEATSVTDPAKSYLDVKKMLLLK